MAQRLKRYWLCTCSVRLETNLDKPKPGQVVRFENRVGIVSEFFNTGLWKEDISWVWVRFFDKHYRNTDSKGDGVDYKNLELISDSEVEDTLALYLLGIIGD
jgi:hypothetical protein